MRERAQKPTLGADERFFSRQTQNRRQVPIKSIGTQFPGGARDADSAALSFDWAPFLRQGRQGKKVRGATLTPNDGGRRRGTRTGNNCMAAVSLSVTREDTVSERPSLGWSAISKIESSSGPLEKFWRLIFLLVGVAVISVVFLWLTNAAQKSTAHATGPDGLHYDPNGQ